MVHVKCEKCGEIRYRATVPCEIIIDGAGQFLEQRGLRIVHCKPDGPFTCENCGWVLEKLVSMEEVSE